MCSQYLIAVSKVFSNHKGRVQTRYKPKHITYAYFLDENGKIKRSRLSKLEYYFFKWFKTKYKKRSFVCEACGHTYRGLVRKDGDSVECPKC